MSTIPEQISRAIDAEVATRHASFVLRIQPAIIRAVSDAIVAAFRSSANGSPAPLIDKPLQRQIKTAFTKRRPRAVVTDATRAKVKELVKAKKTGGEIAKQLGVSLPTVQNIKKALGLVQARKKK